MIDARAEHIGSLLRPQGLLDARAAGASGPALKAAEDAAIREVVALQESAGLPVVNDGEFRRESFQSELTAAVDGFEGVSIDAWLWGEWHSEELGDKSVARPEAIAVVHPMEQRRSLAAEEFAFLRAVTDRIGKVTLPSPSLFANLWDKDRSADAYSTFDDFMGAVVGILQREVKELARLGCEYIQLDAPHYPLLVDPTWRAFYEARGWSAESWLEYGIALDNEVIDAAPEVTFGFHLCRGNQDSRWLVSGGYESIAGPVFENVHAHRLLLEYDDDRSGSFEALSLVPEDKVVVLGLVTTKHARLEDPDDLRRRIGEAARIVGDDRLAISPQCGFATSIVGNDLTIEDERKKLELVTAVASDVWS